MNTVTQLLLGFTEEWMTCWRVHDNIDTEVGRGSGEGEQREDLLRMVSKQTSIAARAPMPSLSVWPSCTSSQFSPQNPSRQTQRQRRRGSWLIQLPPLRHGLSKHSFLSVQPLPSGETMRPSPQLANRTGFVSGRCQQRNRQPHNLCFNI